MVAVEVQSEGTKIPDTYELLYIDVKNEYNRIPYAELAFIGGDIAAQKFPVSESGHFDPGKVITILMGYTDGKPVAPKTVFKGVVVKQSMQMTLAGCTLTAELSDTAIKMTAYRQSQVFENKKDDAIIKKLIKDNGLKPGTVSPTTVQHKKMVQYACTPWDFMLSRAEANGLLVSVKDGAISVRAPEMTAKPIEYTVGIDDIYDFDMEADGRHQYAAVASSSWDVKKGELSAPVKAKEYALKQGDFKVSKIAKAINGDGVDDKENLLSAVSLDKAEVKEWAEAMMLKSRLSMIKGRFRIDGNPKLLVGDVLKIRGISKRFSGETLVSGVHHTYTADGWFTNVQFGLPYERYGAKPNVTEPKAAGLVPGVNGLQIGIVEKFEADPDKEERVKIAIPAISAGSKTKSFLWARLASPSAGSKAGMFFQPEPGDEVILGFLNDDPRQPVILGSVYGSKNAPPLKQADKNPEKGFITKSGIKILIDDEKQLLTLLTSENNSVIINEKDKFIEIKDANKNSIKLSKDGIALNSGKDLIIKAEGKIQMETSAKIEIKGSAIDIT